MRKYFLFIIISTISLLNYNCSDGDLSIEPIEFTDTQVYSCTKDTTTNFLYKTQGKLSLILSFDRNLLTNKVDTITGEIPSKFKLLYRSFDQNPTNAYFCNTPPPSTPLVTSEIEAKGGRVQIITQKITDTDPKNTKYNHLIRITDLVIENSAGEGIISPNFNFGVFQTTKDN